MTTHGGDAVTSDRAIGTSHPVWHLWHDYGLGTAYRQVTVRLEDGEIADLALTGGTAKLDRDDHAYLLGGGAIYRTTAPLR